MRIQTMKKLNITKEQFEKSKYFKNKYGKLEYVSESGKVFKTNKGKVLMFKESFYGIEGAKKDVDGAILYKRCIIEPSEFYANLGEMYDREHPEDPNHEGFDDWCWENTDLIESELEHLASYDDNYEGDPYYKESKKFGRKFKESSNTKDEPYSVYKFINTLRWDYNEYMLEEPKELEETGDGWKQISIMCSKSQHRKMLGVVKEYCQKYGWEYQSHRIDEDVFEIVVSQWDESTLTDDYRESAKKFGRKSVKESVGDVSTDPAYVCPYCGGRNCSFEDADDSPLEGYFDGGTLNA